ncbi:hypothetical protein Tco_1058272 [Tanacetum coccineum]|uniref:Uncharacterized protein n=1 Tax=Tanacetum coccineum TaxID=301880 RepID=A0ABQ5H7Q6_9ASTR
MGYHHHKPDIIRCGCGGLYGSGRHHSGGFRRLTTVRHPVGLRHHSPTPQGVAVVDVPSSGRHHDGGNRSGIFRRFYAFPATVGGQSATHRPLHRSATAGKAATAAVVRGEGGKGVCEGGAVGEGKMRENERKIPFIWEGWGGKG